LQYERKKWQSVVHAGDMENEWHEAGGGYREEQIPPMRGGEGKVHPITCQEGTDGEYRYSSTLSSTLALDWGGWLMPSPDSLTPGNDPLPIVWESRRAPESVRTSLENLASAEIRSSDGPARNESLYLLCHLFFKCPKMQSWREKLLNKKWSNKNEEIALREVLTGNKVTELRNLVNLAHKSKCK
jgi:hypothetical protein